MSEISICTCNVRLSGDIRNVVHRGVSRPVTWPEVEVLMHIHGTDAVHDIEVVDKGDTTIQEEFERLTMRYGVKVTRELFPGKRPAMQLKAPSDIKVVKSKDAPEVADPFAGVPRS